MGYCIEGFAKRENAAFSMARGLEVRTDPPEDIGDITGHKALDEDFVVVNQKFKHLRFGFGKATEQVSEENRLGRMTRAEGIELVRKYDGKCAPRFIAAFRRYLDISEGRVLEGGQALPQQGHLAQGAERRRGAGRQLRGGRMKSILVVDYGVGNLQSVSTALRFLGYRHTVSAQAAALDAAKRPGRLRRLTMVRRGVFWRSSVRATLPQDHTTERP